jgi:hypothetical protein
VLYRNWWPMLTGIMYVLVPMPYLFFGASQDSYGYGSIASGWMDAGKFLTGFSAVGSVAIPAILAHAQVGAGAGGGAARTRGSGCGGALSGGGGALAPPGPSSTPPLPPGPARQVITTGALLMELAAVFVLGATFLVYDYYAQQDRY